ncbi:MAG: ral secretion pathway protein GspK, partial [Rhizobacter sp.]|nr:ral secretion pathway protein GspK [Rhizobacter sp.]
MNTTHPHRERGVALLTAMIIVALVATLASAMVWQQWRAIEVEAAERGRAQSSWILSGALDWARLILREDARAKGNAVPTDNLGEPWAVPLAEARLSTFLAADKDNNTDSGPEAFLSGSITDAQGRYNLNNLVIAGDEAAAQLQVLTRLCELVGVSGDVAGRIARGLNDAAPPSATPPATPPSAPPVTPRSGNPLLMPQNERQLTWLGIEPAALERLLPYVVLLPIQQAKVNVNTASREVIAAATGLDLAGAE